MNGNVIKCECCHCNMYATGASLRGWCEACESEFERVTMQRKARRSLNDTTLPRTDRTGLIDAGEA